MARQTRSERRARREARERSVSDGGVQPTVRPALQTAPSQAGGRELPLAGAKRFVTESIGELKKVEWPGKRQLFSATVVVVIAVAVVGAYLWIADLALSHFVKNVLLNF